MSNLSQVKGRCSLCIGLFTFLVWGIVHQNAGSNIDLELAVEQERTLVGEQPVVGRRGEPQGLDVVRPGQEVRRARGLLLDLALDLRRVVRAGVPVALPQVLGLLLHGEPVGVEVAVEPERALEHHHPRTVDRLDLRREVVGVVRGDRVGLLRLPLEAHADRGRTLGEHEHLAVDQAGVKAGADDARGIERADLAGPLDELLAALDLLGRLGPRGEGGALADRREVARRAQALDLEVQHEPVHGAEAGHQDLGGSDAGGGRSGHGMTLSSR